MDIHKQAIEKISAGKIRKQLEALLRLFLRTVVYLSFIYTSCFLHVFGFYR